MKSRITRMTAALLAAVLSLSLLVGCKPKKELTLSLIHISEPTRH